MAKRVEPARVFGHVLSGRRATRAVDLSRRSSAGSAATILEVGHNVLVEEDAYRLEQARDLSLRETGLAVVVTCRPDGTAHASVVNAGVVDHPVSGEPAVGFVVHGGGRKKLQYLRAQRAATVVFRSGWDWVAVEGDVDLFGPDDRDCVPWPDAIAVFHQIYAAANGGSPDDWDGRDPAIEQEGHVAVLIRPVRVYPNPSR